MSGPPLNGGPLKGRLLNGGPLKGRLLNGGPLKGRLPNLRKGNGDGLNQAFFTAATGLGIFALSAVTGPLLSRHLGATGRGNLAAVTVPAELFGFLLCFGLPDASVYFAKKYGRRQLLMSAWLFAGVAGGTTIASLWWFIPDYLHSHDALTVPWLRFFLVVMITYVPADVAVSLLRARMEMRSFNRWRAFQPLLNALVLVGLAVGGNLTLTTALIASVGSQVVYHLAALTILKAWPGRGFDRKVAGAQIAFGSRLAFGTLSELLVARLDQLFLIGLVSSSSLGIYAVAVTAAGVSGPAALGIAWVLFPRVRAASGPEESWELMRRALVLTLATSTVMAIVVAASAPLLLPLLFGEAFRGSLRPLWLLLPGQVLLDLGNVIAQKLVADHLPGRVSRAYGVAALLTVIGLWSTVKRWGIDAAAIVTTLSQLAYFLSLFVTAKRSHRRSMARPVGE